MYLPHHDFPIAKPFVLPAITLKRGGRPRLEIPPAGHKRCETCRETKPFEAFARHNGSRDGHRNHCRECCITGRRKPIVETVEQRARRKERQSRPVWQTSHAAALKRWDERFPKAKAASIATHYAIARGKVQKATACQAVGCSSDKHLEIHHSDYLQPLVFVTVCAKHHRAGHSIGFIKLKPGIDPKLGAIPVRA